MPSNGAQTLRTRNDKPLSQHLNTYAQRPPRTVPSEHRSGAPFCPEEVARSKRTRSTLGTTVAWGGSAGCQRCFDDDPHARNVARSTILLANRFCAKDELNWPASMLDAPCPQNDLAGSSSLRPTASLRSRSTVETVRGQMLLGPPSVGIIRKCKRVRLANRWPRERQNHALNASGRSRRS